MADQRIDPLIYGAKPLDAHPELAAGSAAVEGYKAPQAVPGVQALNGSQPLMAQGAAQIASDNREEAGVLASVGAAMTQWSPVHLFEYLKAPTFNWTPGFSASNMMQQVDFPMDLTQEKFLLQTKSPEEFQYKLERMREQNDAYKAMGDNGLVAFAAAALDPGYLAIDAVSMGAGRLVEAGAMAKRLTAGGVAAAGAYGIGKAEQQVQPMSEKAVFINAMLNGAATAALFRNGKVEVADPEFPSQQLHDIAQRTEGAPAPLHESHPDFVGPVQAVRAPEEAAQAAVQQGDNLTRPAIEPQGEAGPKVQYTANAPSAASDYLPNVNLSREEQAAMAQGGVVHVNSVDDIAAHSYSVRNGGTMIDKDAKAVYLPGDDKVFLIRDNIKAGDDVKGILLHEVGVHMNAERVLGTQRMGEMLNRLEEMAVQGNARAKAAFESVPKDTPLHLQREEALGYYIEANHANVKDGIVQRFVFGVRELLRKAGLSGMKLTEADIVQLVRKAAKGKARTSFDSTFPYVWHGSPTRRIDQLDTAFMGTGEGNQAFGWGHYLTSEKGTALDYRNKESLKRGMDPEEGGLYRLKINAQEHQFLDLDGRTQSATVQAALDKFGVRPGVTGRTAYNYIAKTLGSQKAATEALYAEGVAGNRYATGSTRGGPQRNSNYVAFHNDVIDTVARYSKGANGPVSQAVAQATVAQKVGKSLEWSLHKTMASYSATAKKVADLLVDDPLEMTGNSVVNQHRAIRADLQAGQIKYEDLLAQHLAGQGAGLLKRIISPRDSLAKQRAVEHEVYMEMLRRNRLSMDGMPISHTGVAPHIKEMADALDGISKEALSEMKRSGVFGADTLPLHSGYISRRWDISKIEDIEGELMAGGLSQDAARQSMRDSMSIGIQRATGWDAQLASDVAKAIYDRTRSKGYFEDTAFRRGLDAEGQSEIRNILSGSGITGSRMQRVLDVLEGKADEAGKAGMLKHRVDMAMDEPIVLPNGQSKTLADMLDTNVSAITDRYLDSVSAQAAFARKGLTKSSDIIALRKEMLESIAQVSERERAAKLFDNTVASLQGNPVGEELPAMMRNAQAVTQMVGLARAGMFQFTEYATAMAQFGAARTVASMFKELPVVRSILGDTKEAAHLSNVLSRNASQDYRIRPFMSRLEDNFEVPVSDAVQMSLMQAKQLTPYLNGLKFVQGHQARMVGNLIVNVFERAAQGDLKALATLEHYGLESPIMQRVRADVAAHGMDTAKWSDATWDGVRAPLTKMMDDAVLRNRTGEIPAFAQFTSTGKFLFTFRSFVLGAHNKVLAGSLHRSGFGGLGLVMLYQMPLTFLATSTANALAGKKVKDDKAALGEAFSQMGSLGLLSEAVGVAFQNKQQFGSPGTIAIDRVYKLGSAAASGNGKQAGAAALGMVPLLSVILPLKAVGENLKDKK